MTKIGEVPQVETGLDPAETNVMALLTAMWTGYQSLPKQHPDEFFEMNRAVAKVQALLAMRVCRRHFPEYWQTYHEAAAED